MSLTPVDSIYLSTIGLPDSTLKNTGHLIYIYIYIYIYILNITIISS